ncbi:hypothetical protein M8J75_014389 [Diaphorina citri]|nr:hypothetical protein M8J75_014389 [Diaphorina citri]
MLGVRQDSGITDEAGTNSPCLGSHSNINRNQARYLLVMLGVRQDSGITDEAGNIPVHLTVAPLPGDKPHQITRSPSSGVREVPALPPSIHSEE